MGSLKLKRVATPILAAAIMASMASVSFAADIGANGIVETSDTAINIPKSVTLYNDGFNKSYLPAITFNFTIAPATLTEEVHITDSNGHTVAVQSGPANSISNPTATAVFEEQEVVDTGATLDETVRKNMTWNVDLTKFTKPGVYRYTITDVTPISTLYAAGLERPSTYDTTRELDVYIKRDATTGNLVVGGYTLHDDITGDITPATEKDPGFVPESFNPGNISNGYDTYTTYNYQVQKNITGEMADLSHKFPFAISLNDGGSVAGLDYYGAAGNATPAYSNAATINTTLGNSDVYHVYALNPKASVSVVETNDTNDSYDLYVTTVNASGSSTDAQAEALAAGAASTARTGNVSTYATANSASNVSGEAQADLQSNGFRNDLPGIITTGVVLKSLPFVALAGIGGLMFALSRKSKKNKVAEDIQGDSSEM